MYAVQCLLNTYMKTGGRHRKQKAQTGTDMRTNSRWENRNSYVCALRLDRHTVYTEIPCVVG